MTNASQPKTLHGPWISIETLENELPALLPKRFACPICGAGIVLESIDGAEEIAPDKWVPDSFQYDCITAPDIDADEWEDYMASHWSMPYVDWLPVEERFRSWLAMNMESKSGRWE